MNELVGIGLWILIFYPAWSPRMRRIRNRGKAVSRNQPKNMEPVEQTWLAIEGDDLDG